MFGESDAIHQKKMDKGVNESFSNFVWIVIIYFKQKCKVVLLFIMCKHLNSEGISFGMNSIEVY